MYYKIVVHVELPSYSSHADISDAITDVITSCGASVIEVEKFQESCYGTNKLNQ